MSLLMDLIFRGLGLVPAPVPTPPLAPSAPPVPQFSVPGAPVFNLEGLPALEEIAATLKVEGLVAANVTLEGVTSLDDYEKGLQYLLKLSKKKARIENLVQKHAPDLMP